jgi:hypothetical protein
MKRFNAIWHERAGDDYSDSTSGIVNCALRPVFAETAGAALTRARDAQNLAPPQANSRGLEWMYP